MHERQPLTKIYPPEIAGAFPRFANQLEEFLERKSGVVATTETPVRSMRGYTHELLKLAGIAALEIRKFIGQKESRVYELYQLATFPSRMVGEIVPGDSSQVGVLI